MKPRFSNVLVVDDSVTVRATLKHALEQAGYEVTTAINGVDALNAMHDLCPDYVLTDWQMPNMNGHTLCRCIRSADSAKYIYIILMTGHVDTVNLVNGLEAGADDYVSKPISVRELLARMQAGSRVLELDRRLTEVARHDPLTGVLNRRDLVQSVDHLIDLSQRRGNESACIMVDLDYFKSINDHHGHLAGDDVLLQVATMLKQQFRTSDFVCRYGGEEFVVVMPDCIEKKAIALAERCRIEIEANAHVEGAAANKITASFGVADTSDGADALELINRADAALLQAKRRGRNRVERYSELDRSAHLADKAHLFASAQV